MPALMRILSQFRCAVDALGAVTLGIVLCGWAAVAAPMSQIYSYFFKDCWWLRFRTVWIGVEY